jgi:hypothetical protein
MGLTEVENVGAEQKPHVAWITILKLMDVKIAKIGCHLVITILPKARHCQHNNTYY